MSKNIAQYLTPRKIVEQLNKYIIGQKEAKHNVAIALRNRWRRMNVTSEIKGDITPNNMLMIGATGVGKTEIARRLGRIANAPFVKVEASKFTEVGYVGRDVESMVRDLVIQAINIVKEEKKEEVKEKARLQVEEVILNALIPPASSTKKKDPSAPEVAAALQKKEVALNVNTREAFRKMLKSGTLDNRKITIEVSKTPDVGIGAVGGGLMEEKSMANLQHVLSQMLPKKKKKRKVTVAEARQLLLGEEVIKLIDMEVVKEEALARAQETGIIFIDEIDKIAVNSGKQSSADVSRTGVQRDLLPIVEGSAVNTHYGVVHTDHILFIAAGAFHIAKPADLIPELQGRFPIRVTLEKLTEKDFIRILSEPKNALTKQYEALFSVEGITLTFDTAAIETLAAMAFKINEEGENIGARRLHTVMSHLLNNFLFDVPEDIQPPANIQITEALVQERLAELVKKKDLSDYIL